MMGRWALRPVIGLLLSLCFLGYANCLHGASLAETYAKRGVQLARDGKLRAAEVEFKRALELQQDLVVAHYYLHKIALQRNDHFAALRCLREVIALDRHYRNAGRVFQELVGTMPRHIRKRLKQNPRDVEAHHVLGFILVHAERMREGVNKLLYARSLDPTRATIYDDLAWAYYKLRRYKKALEYAEKAFNLSAELPSINAHYKKLFYINKFGSKVLKSDSVEDFYPPAKKRLPPATKPATGTKTPIATKKPTPTATATPVATKKPTDTDNPFRTGDAEIDFTSVDIDDQSLVDQLMGSMEASNATTSTTATTKVTEPVDVPPPTKPLKIPSPLKVMKKLKAAYNEGRTLYEQGKYAKARQSFQFIMNLQKDYRDAKSLFERVSRLASARENLAKGQDLLASGAYERALETLRKVRPGDLRLISNLKTVDNLIGECLYHKQSYQQASPYLERWMRIEDDDHRCRYMLAKCLYQEGRFDEAYKHLNIVRDRAPSVLKEFSENKSFFMKLFIKKNILFIAGAAVLWFLLFFGYMGLKIKGHTSAQHFKEGFANLTRLVKEEDWKAVSELCDELESMKPGDVEQYRIDYNRTLALLGQGKTKLAREGCQSLIAKHPQDALSQQLMARVMLAEGELTKDAVEAYRNLLSVEPNNLACLEMLNQYHQANDLIDEEAEKVLVTLRELRPDKREYGLQLCNHYLKTSRFDEEAEHTFRKHLENDETNLPIREGLARCLMAREAYLEGLKECNAILRVEPLRRKTHEVLVDCYKHLEMFDEAAKRYSGLADKHRNEPYFKDLAKSLAVQAKDHLEKVRAEQKEGEDFAQYYNRGVKLYAEGRYADALTPLQAAFRSEKFKLHSGNLLVKIHMRLKDTVAARRVFEQLDLLASGGSDEFVLELCYEMAAIYANEGKKTTALKLYQHICQVDVDFKDAFQRLENLQEEVKLNA